jgi:hypothetical protein
MSESEYIRERDGGAAEQRAAAASEQASETGAPAARKWPLGISLLIVVAVSLILWAGIITAAIRLWRWL